MRQLGEIIDRTETNISGADCDKKRFLVYRCYQTCGGLGDRQKGIVSSYLLALLSGRTFVVDMAFPCNLENFLLPNKYNWRVCMNYILKVPKHDSTEYFTIDSRYDYEKVFTRTDIRYSWDAEVVILNINWYAISIIRYYLKKDRIPSLEWIRNARNEEVIKTVLDVLFRPKTAVSGAVNSFLDKSVGNKRLVCSHIRVGRNPSMPNDEDFSHSRGIPDIKKIMNFLSLYNETKIFSVYVATDSEYVRKVSAERLGNCVSMNRAIVHIDRLRVKKELGCVGFYSVITEQLLLTKCDILLLTMSNFGILAAIMRDRTEGLYTYNVNDNTIVSVRTGELLNQYYIE